MSIDDRDWHRDIERERVGLKPKWQLWKLKRLKSIDVGRNPPRPWHPVLSIVLFVVICLGTLFLLRFFKR